MTARTGSLTEQALDALDAHLRHWETLGTPVHHDAVSRFLEVYNDTTRHWIAQGKQAREAAIAQWTLDEELIWNHAPTVVLDQHVHRLVTEASAFLPPAPLLADVVPSPAGVVMLPGLEPLLDYSTDVDRETAGIDFDVPCVAIAWRISQDILYTAGPDSEAGDPQHAERRGGVDLFLYAPRHWAQRLLAAEPGGWLKAWPSPFLTIDRTPWAFNAEWRPPHDAEEQAKRLETLPDGTVRYIDQVFMDEGVIVADDHVATLRRFLLALWSFMADEITTPEPIRLPRPNLKRLRRAGHMAEIPEDGVLRIIHLRRYAETEDRPETDPDREAPNWSHRWYVRPHWRRLASGRVTYVHGYLKGPEDRPIVLKNNIVAVRR